MKVKELVSRYDKETEVLLDWGDNFRRATAGTIPPTFCNCEVVEEKMANGELVIIIRKDRM